MNKKWKQDYKDTMRDFHRRIARKKEEITRMYMRRGFPPTTLIHIPGKQVQEGPSIKWKFYLGPESGAMYCLPSPNRDT